MSGPVLLLVHGWGFDADFWTPLRDRLTGIETAVHDLGFRGRPAAPEATDRPIIAIGHSLGFLWLAHTSPVSWTAWISINGFTRFAQAEDFEPGVPTRLLDRMAAKFERDATTVTADFLARCGSPDRPGRLDEPRLAAGLGWLGKWDARAALARDAAPGQVLAGRRDPIVSPGMTRACFADEQAIWHETGGHLLPRHEADWTAARIRDFVARL